MKTKFLLFLMCILLLSAMYSMPLMGETGPIIVTGTLQFPRLIDDSGKELEIQNHPQYKMNTYAAGIGISSLSGARVEIYGDPVDGGNMIRIRQYRVLAFPDGFQPVTLTGVPRMTGTDVFPVLQFKSNDGNYYQLQGSESLEPARLDGCTLKLDGHFVPGSDCVWVDRYEFINTSYNIHPTAIGIMKRGVDAAYFLADEQGNNWIFERGDKIIKKIERNGYMGGKIWIWGDILNPSSHPAGTWTGMDSFKRVKVSSFGYLRRKDEMYGVTP